MISVWWLIPAIMAGVAVGFFFAALCYASGNRGDDDEQR